MVTVRRSTGEPGGTSPRGSVTDAATPSQSANVPSVQMGEPDGGGESGVVQADRGDEGGECRDSRDVTGQHRSTRRPCYRLTVTRSFTHL